MSRSPITRRRFLKAGAAAGTVAASAKSYANVKGANDRLNVGMIGCGGMASGHLRSLLHMAEDENIAVRAVCDVHGERAENFSRQIADTGGKAKVKGHYSELVRLKDLDYVVVATPEHSHHYLTMAALDEGLHVYCEKPMCYNIAEAKDVVAKVSETGLQLQVGVQGMSDDSYSSAYEAIREGKLGQVVQAQIDYVRNYALDSGPWRRGIDPGTPKPKDLDWKTWVQPREARPWNPNHFFEWRCYQDYSGGISTDLFVHRITRIIRACGLQFPKRVTGMGGIYTWDDGRDLPDSMEVLLEYPDNEAIANGMTVHLLGTMANKNGNKHCIRGQQATLQFTGTGWDIISEDTGKVLESHQKTGAEDVTPHHKNHHAAIRDGVPLNCPAELGLYGVVAARMGNLSWFAGKTVAWNAARQVVEPA